MRARALLAAGLLVLAAVGPLGAQSKTFNGTTDVITIAAHASIAAKDTFTASAWIKPASMGEGGAGRIWNKTEKQLQLSSAVTNGLRCDVFQTTTQAQAISNNNAITLNEWQYVAMSYVAGDGGCRLWRGTLSTAVAELSYSSRSGGSGTPNDDTAIDLLLGNRSANDRTFDGPFAHVTWWDQVLTAAQHDVVKMAPFAPKRRFATSGGTVINCLGYWPLTESGASTARDHCPNANHGTVSGTTVSTGPPGLVSWR